MANRPDLTPLQLALFWTQVRRVEGGCWLWEGYVGPKGYGDYQVDGAHWRVHRLSYELLRSPIGAGMVLDHLCRVRNCVRPSHLEQTTPAENVLRGEGITASAKRRDTCAVGHPYTPENTYVCKNGWRQCRTCQRERRRQRRAVGVER